MYEFHRNPRLEQELLDRLAAKYLTEKKRPHLTQMIYCLTRSYFDEFDPLPPVGEELLRYAIGFGLETVLLRDPGVPEPESVQLDGIWLTPDYVSGLSYLDGGVDLKSTRMYPNRESGVPQIQKVESWPESWMEQFMGYTYLGYMEEWISPTPDSKLPYSVAVVFLGPPALTVGTFLFPMDSVMANWANVHFRLGIYSEAVSAQKPPPPYTYSKNWECRGCRYAMRCQTIVAQAKGA